MNGEFSQAKQLRARLATGQAAGIATPNGDDAAVLAVAGNVVLTTDALVEGKDFAAAWPFDAVGHKALAASLSDLAAMGAKAVGYLLVVCAPPSASPGQWDGLTAGLERLGASTGVGCVGGDLSATDGPWVITVTGVGQMEGARPFTRAGACPGHGLYVTGALGGAARGVAWLLSQQTAYADTQQTLNACTHPAVRAAVRAQLAPQARLQAGVALRGVAHACLDVSDGLLQDLAHLLVQSGVGAELDAEALPTHGGLADLDPAVARHHVLCGGEDYELLFSASADLDVERVAAACGVAVTRIGTVVAERRLRTAGQTLPWEDLEALHMGQPPHNRWAAGLRGHRHAL